MDSQSSSFGVAHFKNFVSSGKDKIEFNRSTTGSPNPNDNSGLFSKACQWLTSGKHLKITNQDLNTVTPNSF